MNIYVHVKASSKSQLVHDLVCQFSLTVLQARLFRRRHRRPPGELRLRARALRQQVWRAHRQEPPEGAPRQHLQQEDGAMPVLREELHSRDTPGAMTCLLC